MSFDDALTLYKECAWWLKYQHQLF
jgi:hypothetical protein